MNIIEALHSDSCFRSLFKDIETWHSWEVYLRVLYGLPIEDRELRLGKSQSLRSRRVLSSAAVGRASHSSARS